MKKIIYIILLIMFSSGLHAQDITNWEKSKLEAYVKDLAIKEVNANPAFEEFRVTNTTPVKFDLIILDEDYSHITDKQDMDYGTTKGDSLMRVTFFKTNKEDFIVKVIILLKEPKIQSILRGDNLILSGDIILNKK